LDYWWSGTTIGGGGRAITVFGAMSCGGDCFFGRATRLKLLLTTEKY
jgi:hypothetical protein